MMAPVELPNARALAAWPNVLAGLFTLLVFVALRLLEGETQKVVLGVAAVVYVAMLVGRVRGRLAADAAGKRLLLLVGGPADTLLLVGAALATWHRFGADVHELVLAAGVLALIAGAGLTLSLELAEAPMRQNAVVDNRRIEAAARTAGTLLAALAGLVAFVYGVNKLDVRRDFSFAAPTSPSPATLSLLDAAACGEEKGKPEIFLFFERGSAALGEVRDYFEGLEHKGARVTVQDSAFDPALAKQMKVTKNGTVGLRCGERSESWVVGDDRDDAQKKLNKLDEEVRTRLAKISKDAATVYVTVGHGERTLEDAGRPGERTAARNLKRLVEGLNGKTKKLGLADGLSKEVPGDASLVIVAGPTQPFLPEEAQALASYVEQGGALLLLLDPPLPAGRGVPPADVVGSLEPLLARLGVSVGTHEVLNDKAYVKESNTNADHAFLFSTSFGSHKSVKTLSGARGKAALLFKQATNVDKRSKGEDKEGPKVSLLARTAAASFIDVNDDRKNDEGAEARAIFDLAAAVEIKAGEKEGRAVVVGDSDVLADFLLVNSEANQVFGYELLLWLLRDDDKVAGGVQSPEDVRILHTRDGDKLWFYGTVFLVPALLLGAGMFFVRRRRARPRTGGQS